MNKEFEKYRHIKNMSEEEFKDYMEYKKLCKESMREESNFIVGKIFEALACLAVAIVFFIACRYIFV